MAFGVLPEIAVGLRAIVQRHFGDLFGPSTNTTAKYAVAPFETAVHNCTSA